MSYGDEYYSVDEIAEEDEQDIYKAMRMGDVFTNMHNLEYKVLDDINPMSVIVRFTKSRYKVMETRENVLLGHIVDKLAPIIHGVGFIGLGKYQLDCPQASVHWLEMISTCYDTNGLVKTKHGVTTTTVGSEWHNYQSFAKWHNRDANKCGSGYTLYCTGEVYSKDTCFYVPLELLDSVANESDTDKIEDIICHFQYVYDLPRRVASYFYRAYA